jgi:hypothetical protein
MLGKRNNREEEDDKTPEDKNSAQDIWERKFKAPRTDTKPRIIPQLPHLRGKGGVAYNETTLIQIGGRTVDCTDQVVFYYLDSMADKDATRPHFCHIPVNQLQDIIWTVMTEPHIRGKKKAVQGNFSVEKDIGTISAFVNYVLNDPDERRTFRKTFLQMLKDEAEFVSAGCYEDTFPINAAGTFFIRLKRYDTHSNDFDAEEVPQEDEDTDNPSEDEDEEEPEKDAATNPARSASPSF